MSLFSRSSHGYGLFSRPQYGKSDLDLSSIGDTLSELARSIANTSSRTASRQASSWYDSAAYGLGQARDAAGDGAVSVRDTLSGLVSSYMSPSRRSRPARGRVIGTGLLLLGIGLAVGIASRR